MSLDSFYATVVCTHSLIYTNFTEQKFEAKQREMLRRNKCEMRIQYPAKIFFVLSGVYVLGADSSRPISHE